jgi:hypothetical protein
MGKRPLPVTHCTNCAKAGYRFDLVQEPCGQMIHGKRCKGSIQSATEINDWAACPSCNATGWVGATCAQCDGAGWLFAREKKDTESVRRARVRQLFEARLDKEHTEDGVLKFYEWLRDRHPDLLQKPRRGDPYLQLKLDLAGIWRA